VREIGARSVLARFFTMSRSEWTGTPYEEQPYDVEKTLAYFEAANATG